jgi:DNA-directed RNA polymerase subunit K/omega
MSKLRRQMSANIPSVVETKNLTDIKSVTGNLYESIAIISRRANQINISLREELHNKLEEFASHTDSLEEIHRNSWRQKYTTVKMMKPIFSANSRQPIFKTTAPRCRFCFQPVSENLL